MDDLLQYIRSLTSFSDVSWQSLLKPLQRWVSFLLQSPLPPGSFSGGSTIQGLCCYWAILPADPRAQFSNNLPTILQQFSNDLPTTNTHLFLTFVKNTHH